MKLGGPIGADVPFFLAGGTALGLGRGEEIYPLVDLPPHWIVIARPPFGVSTAEAYAWYDEDRAAGLREVRELQLLPVPWPSRAAQMINDLEPPVLRRHPEIGTLKAQLKEAGAIAAAMSGSGSAVFGLFRSRASAERMVKPLSRGGGRALLTRTISRAEHERRARSDCPAAAGTVNLSLCGRASGSRRGVLGDRSSKRHHRIRPVVRARLPDPDRTGAWPSGKARDFGSRIRRFESSRPNHVDRSLPTPHGAAGVY